VRHVGRYGTFHLGPDPFIRSSWLDASAIASEKLVLIQANCPMRAARPVHFGPTSGSAMRNCQFCQCRGYTLVRIV